MDTNIRLATLERQLQRYLARPLPPTHNPRQLKRRLTYRRRVVREHLRRQRALQVNGHERGWTTVALTEDDAARAERLATQPPMAYYLEIRSQKSGGSSRTRWGGPDRYVAVQIVPYGVAPLVALNTHVARRRGIRIKHFGAGYSRHAGPRSMLGQALAAARAYIEAHRML